MSTPPFGAPTLHVNLSLAIQFREQYLIGKYQQALDTWKQVEFELEGYLSNLNHTMETDSCSSECFTWCECELRSCSSTLGRLREEAAVVTKLLNTCKNFQTTPTLPERERPIHSHQSHHSHHHHHSHSHSHPPSHAPSPDVVASCGPPLPEAPKDPDVWPPPTPAPEQARVKRTNNQWGSAKKTRPEPDDSKFPSWARDSSSSNSAASVASSVPPPEPRRITGVAPKLSRQSSNPPAAAASVAVAKPVRKPPAVSSTPSSSSSAAGAVTNRKPAVPQQAKKNTAKTKDNNPSTAAASVDADGKKHYVSNNPEIQPFVDIIENEILDRSPNVKFSSIAGLSDVKHILEEAIIWPSANPELFSVVGSWKGVLMFGPPGTGKTLLAKAVATECNTTFFNVSPGTFVSKMRGDSEKMVAALFDVARFHAPSTIFIDEVDGIFSQRGGSGEHEASRRFKMELLQQMDGATHSNKGVIVLGATNLPWELDEAARRRFEKRVYIPLPDIEGRRSLFPLAFNKNGQTAKLTDDVDFDELAAMSEGYSGADIDNICKDAAMMRMRRAMKGKTLEDIKNMRADQFEPISQADFQAAFAKIQRSVGKNDLAKFEQWQAEFGAA